jgi:ATP-dependent DNA helicase RecG
MFSLNTPIENLYLVGPARAKLFKKLDINTLEDLLFYFPRAHNDLSHITNIVDLKPNIISNIKGKILEIKSFRTKTRRMIITQAIIEDETASILCVWYNQPYLNKILNKDDQFLFSGKVILDKNKLVLQNPIYEKEKLEQVHTARLVPVYSLTSDLTQKILRSIIKTYLDKTPISEFLPAEIIKKENLMTEGAAVNQFHFPENYNSLLEAKKRLAFDEIFTTQTRVLQYKISRQKQSSFVITNTKITEEKIKFLPFQLTNSQKQAIQEIISDYTEQYPANRLLEGDVGSGKTIIAALTMWLMAKNQFQSAMLCPTEVLAVQHYNSLLEFFQSDNLSLGLLTSENCKFNGNPVSRQTLLSQLESGKISVLIGTHALLEDSVKSKFNKLALVVVDEQHRFGVQQRSILNKLSNSHLLTMSATPIPRTLTLTLYGDLDVSVLKELPKGRLPIKTYLVPTAKRNDSYEFIRKEILNGRQCFIVCPLVEESDKLGVKAATAEFKRLSEEIFPQFKLGLMHGKLKPADKEKAMQDFKENKTQILVSTSVVEVGVDVPNATIMVIEGAQRFGLAQLHQFRGRVGRGNHQSYCLLFSDEENASDNPRLQAIIKSTNGFELAEEDLQIRGSGDPYGTTQSGYNFKIADLADLELVKRSKTYVEKLLQSDYTLKQYPFLRQKVAKQGIIHLE